VSLVLASATASIGVVLGLFGVLSIIRLRSTEISQREVAYYFAALAIGLVAGLPATEVWIPTALIALILTVMWVADHPRLLGRSRHQVIHVDRAIADEDDLRAELESRLGATVTSLTVQHLDLVDDTTLVDVRFRLGGAPVRAVSEREQVLAGAGR
jgi:Ca2+/Na+ antiporter